MKKILLILGLVLSFSFVVSCDEIINQPITNPNEGTEYQINYYSNGKKIETSLMSYCAGKLTVLPVLENTETANFLGWYKNSSFTGNPVTAILASEYGEKAFYAKWDKEDTTPTLNTSLADALKHVTNYIYKVSYTDSDNYQYEYDYYYMDGSIKSPYDYEGITYTNYLMYDEKNDSYTFYYEEEKDSYVAIKEDDASFEYYIADMDYCYLDTIDASNYKEKDGKYIALEDKLADEAANILGGTYEGETFNSLTLEVKEGYLQRIVITSTVISDTYGTYTTNYTISLSGFDTVHFNAPDATIISTTQTIQEVRDISDNELVVTEGFVTAIVGNSFYIYDGEASVYVYMSKTAVEDLKLGSYVVVSGTKTTYKGLVEIKDVTSVTLSGEEEEITPSIVYSLSELKDYDSKNITIQGLKVKTIPTSIDATQKVDVSLIVTDGVSEVTLFISKNLSEDVRTSYYNMISTLKVGDIIDISNAVVSVFNDYQIALTENATITRGYQPGDKVEITKITTNVTKLTVDNGTDLENAAAKIIVYSYFNNGTQETLDPKEYSYTCPNYNAYNQGTYTLTITYQSFTTTVEIKVKGDDLSNKPDPDSIKRLVDVAHENGVTRGMPSIGDAKALIIPVCFTDYPAPTSMKSDLEKVFFGTSTDTGWESLQSYYAKASYGKLNITGTVLEPYNTGKKSTYYSNLYKQNEKNNVELNNPEYEIIKSALEYYDSTINYSDYDSDGDGYIDALYIIYSAPVDYDNGEFWWAYTYEYYTDSEEYYDGVEADFYFFAGMEFTQETPANGKKLKYNAETFIHETGHILGLDDYYDYDESTGPSGGIGGGDMMDWNVGDHNAFSKMLLGWVTPIVVDDADLTTNLRSFGSSGDCVIICKNWTGSIFSEYYIIDFYTPDGLNAFEAGSSGLFSKQGVRIYHVDATLATKDIDGIWYLTKYDNSYTAHRLISLVQASGSTSIDKGGNSSNTDLFLAGESYTGSKWYDKTATGFTMKVNTIENDVANISITFK